MKKIVFLIVFISVSAFSQNKYLTKNGLVNFEASVPAFEEIKASNKTATAIINVDNGDFASLVLVKGFRFKNALMEEHFNENYAESDTHPKSVFKGRIVDFSTNSSSGDFLLNGNLSFHGVTKPVNNISVVITKSDAQITLKGSFKVKVSDFDIKIPSVVKNKISEDVEILFDFVMAKK